MHSEYLTDTNKKNSLTRLISSFADSKNNLALVSDRIAPDIALSADKIVNALLNENKLLICGNGSSAVLGQYMASEFINRFESERPALPAIALSADNSVIVSISNDYHFDEVYSRQIQALAQKGDILLAFVSDELGNSMVNAIQSAHEKNMVIIIISGETSEDISPFLQEQDQLIQFPLCKRSHILELQLLSLHNICDLIDHLLFGTP